MGQLEMMISSTHIGVQSVCLWYVWLCIDCISMQSMHSISIYVIVVLPKWAPDVLCYEGVYGQGLRRKSPRVSCCLWRRRRALWSRRKMKNDQNVGVLFRPYSSQLQLHAFPNEEN